MKAWIRSFRRRLFKRTAPITRAHGPFRPAVLWLETREVPAVDITAFNLSAGTVTFTGDRNGTTADSLLLSQVTVDLGGGNTEVRLAHNLVGGGGTGNYADVTDVDPGVGVAHIVIGSGSAPQVAVNLGTDDDSLTFDNTWTFTDKVVLDGGSGTNTLQNNDAAGTWIMTGPAAGNLNGAGAVSFSNVQVLAGGAGGDTVVGENVASTWTAADATTYDDGDGPVTLVGMATLQGGSAADTFNLVGDSVLGAATGNFLGGGGADTFVLGSGVLLNGSLDGQAGSDVLDASSAVVGMTVLAAGPNGYDLTDGSATYAGIDSVSVGGGWLAGMDAASTWSLGASQSYKANAAGSSLAVSGFSTLQGGSAADAFNVTANTSADLRGGAGADSFAISNGVTLAGTVDGESGSDTLNLSAYTTALSVSLSGATADGYAGTDGVTAGFANIDVLTAGTGSDTLTGEDSTATWSLGATKTYSDGTATLTFSNFETLQGGAAADTFNVTVNTTAALKGGAGADSFAFANGVTLTGTIDGQAGTDTLNLSAYTNARNVVLSGSGANGYSGTDGVTSGFAGIDAVVGGTASDTLTGENVTATWSLGVTKSYSDGTASLTFSSFETLQGGSAADTFAITANTTASLKGGAGDDAFTFAANGVTLSGSIDGQAGTDTLSYAGYTSAVSVALVSSGADGFNGTGTGLSSGFTNIDAAVGGAGAADTITGEDVASDWTLAGTTTSYSDGANALGFAAFETAQGGADVDTFALLADTTINLNGGGSADTLSFAADGAYLYGTFDGQAGADTLDYSGYTSPVSVNLAALAATGVRAFANVEGMVGGAGTSTLVGANVANTWTVTGTDQGSVDYGSTSFGFANVGNLLGGGSTDSFLVAPGAQVSGSINGGAGTDTLSFASFTNAVNVNITANNGGTVTSSGVAVAFAAMENVTGGSGNDTFAIGNGKSISGTLNGGGGADTLDYSAWTTSVRVNLSQGAALNVKGGTVSGAVNFENVTGGAGADILIGDGGNNVLVGNGGNDVLTGLGGDDTLLGGDGMDIMIGGNGADVLDGGNGDDLLIANRTSYDTNVTQLSAMMSEWGRTDVTYATKIAHLTGSLAGGRNGSVLLNASNVFDDSAADTLTGGAGLDWFVNLAPDFITDLNNGGIETKTNL